MASYSNTTLRDTWEFNYTCKEIADAAREKAAYHRGREEWWKAEADEAQAAIQESGIDVKSYEITGGHRHEVQVDPSLVGRMGEARDKWQKHRKLAEDYEQWTRVLDRSPDGFLQLKLADVAYFGL